MALGAVARKVRRPWVTSSPGCQLADRTPLAQPAAVDLAVHLGPRRGKELLRGSGDTSLVSTHSRERRPGAGERPVCGAALDSKRADKNEWEVWAWICISDFLGTKRFLCFA